MLNIDDNNNITLTKGDTLTLTIALTLDGEPYTPVEGDSIRLAISKGYLGEYGYVLKLDKAVDPSTLTVTVTAEETGALNYTEYNYDVEITHQDGTVDTFISATLTITGEVK